MSIIVDGNNDVSFDLEKSQFNYPEEFKWGFLIVYAEWCSHCKTLKPVIDFLSKNLVNDGVKFFMLNGENSKFSDVFSSLDVSGYPTIFSLKPNNTSYDIIKYNGDRSVKDFLVFLSSDA